MDSLDTRYKGLEAQVNNFVLESGVKIDTRSGLLKLSDESASQEADVKINKHFIFLVKEALPDILIYIFYAMIAVYTLKAGLTLFYAIRFLDLMELTLPTWASFSVFGAWVLLWIISTLRTEFNFHNKKIGGLVLGIINGLILFMTEVYRFFYNMILPSLLNIEVNEMMTANKVVGLYYLATLLPTIILTILLIKGLFSFFTSHDTLRRLKDFKLKHYLPVPEDKFAYNASFVRDMSNGKRVIIPEHDRFLHGEAIGATGTAKTSSVLFVQIIDDLDTKMRNIMAQKKWMKKLVDQNIAEIKKPFDDKDFSTITILEHFGAVKGKEKQFEEQFKRMMEKHKNAGITVIAPDSSLTDSVYERCEKLGLPCNRIDPQHNEDGSIKKGSKGYNPFYISPLIPEWERAKEMVKCATMTADIMQIMNERGGKSGDPYFASVNRTATITAAMATMLCQEKLTDTERGKPSILRVRDLLNDFDKAHKYLPILEDINARNNNIYAPICAILKNQFLGPSSAEFYKHCNGLRQQLSNFLMHPDIARILSSEESVDFDKMLREGQVTVINIELGDLGPIDSPCFGMFITIPFINAVLRRKGTEWTRPYHFLTVDEFPVIVHPAMESCFTLFRKFRTAMTVAIQTLDQMDKTPYLQYLRGVLLNSCGWHVTFGRTNISDQKTFSILSGTKTSYDETVSYNESPLVQDNPRYDMRYTQVREERPHFSESEIHNRDFQEVSFFYTKEGRPISPIHGRVDFVKKSRLNQKPKEVKVDWYNLYNKQGHRPTLQNIEPVKDNALQSPEPKIELAGIYHDLSSEMSTKLPSSSSGLQDVNLVASYIDGNEKEPDTRNALDFAEPSFTESKAVEQPEIVIPDNSVITPPQRREHRVQRNIKSKGVVNTGTSLEDEQIAFDLSSDSIKTDDL